MLKSISKIKGVKTLDKSEQKEVNGGWVSYPGDSWGDECPWNMTMNCFGRCTMFPVC